MILPILLLLRTSFAIIPASSLSKTTCGTLQPHPRSVENLVSRNSAAKPCSSGLNIEILGIFLNKSAPKIGHVLLSTIADRVT